MFEDINTLVRESRCVFPIMKLLINPYKTNLVRQVDILRKAHVSSHVVRRACYFYNDNMVLVGPYK